MTDEMHDAVQPAQPVEPVQAAEVAETAPPATPVTTVVVSSRIRQVIKGKGMRSSGQLAEAVNAKVLELLDRAADIAREDGRATIRPRDVLAA